MLRVSSTVNEVWVLRFWIAALIILMAVVAEITAQKPASFCSLFDPANEGKLVTSTALMFHSTVSRVDGGDTFLYASDCNGPDYFAIPEAKSHVWNAWTNFYRRLPAEKNLVLEIKFEGKSEIATAYLFGSLDGWARVKVTLSKIISIKDVTKTKGTLANWDAQKPEVERIERMRASLDIFLRSLFSPGSTEQAVPALLSDDFRFVDLDGKVIRKGQYESLKAPWATAPAIMKESRITRRLISSSRNTMQWRATFDLVFNAATSKTYFVDLTLEQRNGEWVIRQVKMLTKP